MPSQALSPTDFPREICLEAINRLVTVETSKSCTFKGILQGIDSLGNIELVDVRCTDSDSSITIEEKVFIRKLSIRLIHLPMELKLSPLLNWHNEKLLHDIRASVDRKPPKKDSVKSQKVKKNQAKKVIDKKIRKLKR